MAVITIDQDVSWGGARWVFDYVIEHLTRRLAGTGLGDELVSALESGLAHLDLTGKTAAEKALLREGVRAIADCLEKPGGEASVSPELHGALLRKVRELEACLLA